MTAKSKAPIAAVVVCSVCSVKEPLATAHDHHRTPRAFGGTDDPTNRVWLCASCHNRLHRVAGLLAHGKTDEAYQLCHMIFPTDAGQRGNLWTFGQEAAKAEIETKDAFGLHRTRTRVSLEIDNDVWAKVKLVAKSQKKSAAQIAAILIANGVERVE